jgi:23S rRNA (cytosine1962-C5)-methyltransferase
MGFAMAYPVIQLREGREASVGFHHPWVFSGALESIPKDLAVGSLVHITDRNGRIIGTGSFEGEANIAVRVFDFSEVTIDEAWIASHIQQAENRRLFLGYGPDMETSGYRIVFGEADLLPGLVIDRYSDVLVLQISSAGMETLLPLVITVCKELFSPRAIVERSGAEYEIHYGSLDSSAAFTEHGMKFVADVLHGQKTGFFLDQKDLRKMVATYAKDRAVLNLFSYTGATGIAALTGGATSVHNVDESMPALEVCAAHATMNGFEEKNMTTEEADVFGWLGEKREETYGMVIVDPPALAKTKREVEQAKKAYHFLNRAAMRLTEDNGIFITSSCSHFFSEDDFLFTLRRASVQAGITLDVLHMVRQSSDHPLSVYFPESLYLKSFICRVRRV